MCSCKLFVSYPKLLHILCPFPSYRFLPCCAAKICSGLMKCSYFWYNCIGHHLKYFTIQSNLDSGGKLSTRLYDKRDDFDFHIVNFPYLSSNIPSGPSYGVYISQLIRYARCCSHYDDFRYRHKCLVDRLLSQGYIALRLEKSFMKFYGRYQDLIEKYQRSVNVMVNDSFPG